MGAPGLRSARCLVSASKPRRSASSLRLLTRRRGRRTSTRTPALCSPLRSFTPGAFTTATSAPSTCCWRSRPTRARQNDARAARRRRGPGHRPDPPDRRRRTLETATLGISPRTKRVLEAAGIQAAGSVIAAREHVLLALSAQRDAVAAQILRDLGASDDQLRFQLSELLAGEAPELAAMLREPPRRRLRRAPRRRQAD
jgi:hypothetical protein